MNLSFLGPFHPQIVHTPIALLVFSAVFALAARLFDRDWLRKTSVLLLVVGFVGAWFAVQSGGPAHRVPEHEQGVPEEAIHRHEEAGERVLPLAAGAIVAIALAARLGGAAAAFFSGLGLALQVAAAVMVGIAGFHGGKLTYEHGANVRVEGRLVKSSDADSIREARERRRAERAAERAAEESGRR